MYIFFSFILDIIHQSSPVISNSKDSSVFETFLGAPQVILPGSRKSIALQIDDSFPMETGSKFFIAFSRNFGGNFILEMA